MPETDLQKQDTWGWGWVSSLVSSSTMLQIQERQTITPPMTYVTRFPFYNKKIYLNVKEWIREIQTYPNMWKFGVIHLN